MPSHYAGSEAEVRALDAYVKLSRAAAAVEARINRHLAEAGLSISQFGVLEALWHLGPLSQGALARKILKSPANLTTVLDNLAKRDLIRRSRDPGDRRVLIVSLTEDGRARIASLFPRHVGRVVAAFASLDAEDQETLARLCRTVGLAQGPGNDGAADPRPPRQRDAEPAADAAGGRDDRRTRRPRRDE